MIGQTPRDYTNQELLVASVLDELGMRYIEQYEVGTRTVDLLIPELAEDGSLGVVVEVDGYYGHSRKSDTKRDQELLDGGVDEVWHVTASKREEVREFLLGKLNTYGNRWDLEDRQDLGQPQVKHDAS